MKVRGGGGWLDRGGFVCLGCEASGGSYVFGWKMVRGFLFLAEGLREGKTVRGFVWGIMWSPRFRGVMGFLKR